MQSHIRSLLFLMILFALFARPTPVFACSCIMPGPPSAEFSQADAVFQGQVLSMVDRQNAITSLLNQVRLWMGLAPHYNFNVGDYGLQVTLSVSRSWKGVTTTITQVSTGYGGGDCGYLFKVGADYLIYAYGPPHDLSVVICSRTTEVSHASEDLSYLSTRPGLSLTTVSPTPWPPVLASVSIVVMAMAMVIFWFLRQRRHKNL
jgi:hypothetical protein